MRNNDACGIIGDKIPEKNLENRITSIDEMPLFLNVLAVAEILEIGRNSAYCLFRSVGFPSLRIAGQLRVYKYDFLDWLKTQKIK